MCVAAGKCKNASYISLVAVSDPVGNPDDMFSRDEPQKKAKMKLA